MTRTNYIFVDFENVQETELERIEGKPAHLTLILGDKHKHLPVAMVVKIHKYAGQVTLVRNTKPGRNALDMVLAFHVGVRKAADPAGYVHVISKDSDFEALLQHLRDSGGRAAQHDSLAQIPMFMNRLERFHHLCGCYGTAGQQRPGCRKALENDIQARFARTLNGAELEGAVSDLLKAGVIEISDGQKVTFTAMAKSNQIRDIKATAATVPLAIVA